ncbi:hypothetical protein FO440_17665 [Mucilaginibacter corticis]|uniref:Uncharacterized protein n=1 Tax=Mucilaginibacter corticis TaxID=2597670 RepID=A0A556MI34_9SPHI|nr:DUF6348 family protein [Mucilaginibacter corticis]TSJ39570.1 hypothetical protein FO440_17665 [Mucilaginibacter corticis]
MGLFDFFKKKITETPEDVQRNELPRLNKNAYVLAALESRLVEMGYRVERHTQYLSIIVNNDLEIGVMVVENPDSHPSIMHLMVSASHAIYFPDGIIESIVGAGLSIEDQTNTALNNYITSTFVTIIDSFTDSHDPDLDFMAMINGEYMLFHPKLGDLLIQGEWSEQPQTELIFDLLKDKIPSRLSNNKINWLKVYISKRADGEIIGECLFNNVPWELGEKEIFNYAKSWEMPGEFKGMKQFILFRRCDAYDKVNNISS